MTMKADQNCQTPMVRQDQIKGKGQEMKDLLIGQINYLRNDFYGYTHTLCVDCDDTIEGIAFMDADTMEFYCQDCGKHL